jgi:hypothetical protein
MNNMVLMIFNVANILQGALIYAVNTVFIPVKINLISLHLLYYLSKVNLIMCINSIERSSFMERYCERTSFMDVIRAFMEIIRAFMETIRAFMEYDSIGVHQCAKFIGLLAQKVLKNYM